jgi:hypothetical protein
MRTGPSLAAIDLKSLQRRSSVKKTISLAIALFLCACGQGDGGSSPAMGQSEDEKTVQQLGVPVPPNAKIEGVLKEIDDEKFKGTSINIKAKMKQADAVAWYADALPKNGFQNIKAGGNSVIKSIDADSKNGQISISIIELPDEQASEILVVVN